MYFTQFGVQNCHSVWVKLGGFFSKVTQLEIFSMAVVKFIYSFAHAYGQFYPPYWVKLMIGYNLLHF
jgi:hypothetical protein